MEKFAEVLLYMVPLLFSVSFHEAAHGWVANRRGDPTAKMLGRITLNPLPHIDPVGSIAVPAIFYFLSGGIIAWAKPVPVVERNLKDQRWDFFRVAIAGPASNLILAVGFTLLFAIAYRFNPSPDALGLGPMLRQQPLLRMFWIGVHLNVALAILNLIPIPPLDGSRIWGGLFPQATHQLRQIERYGFFILIGLMMLGVLRYIVFIPTTVIASLLLSFAI